MAESTTPYFGYSYYAQGDVDWHTGRNNSIQALDTDLYDLGAGHNFIPHSLFLQDSDSDGIPDLWAVSADSCTITKALATSEVYGFAKKIQLTISNSSGSTKYPEFKLSAQIPPNRKIVLSSWLKSADLAVQLRMYDGTSNFDSTAQVEATVVRRNVSANQINIAATYVDIIVRVTVPDGTVSKLVEVHMPMLHVGDTPAGFVPATGEMAQLLVNDLYVYGTLETNLDFNQNEALQLQLENRTSAPGSPENGQIWFDNTAGVKKVVYYDGTNSEELSLYKYSLANEISDPGDGNAIPVTDSGVVPITTAGAETNTLAAPSFIGQQIALICDVYVGDRVVTVATTINQTGNNTITLGAAADMIVLTAMQVAGSLVWRVTANDGAALSTV